MSDRIAIDQHIRDRAIGDIATSIALSAGAGSGKTSVLVARVLSLLRSGVEARRIAAITFTEKASGELQERVRDGLEDALRHEPGNATLQQALAQASELLLSTIHSFCQQLFVAEALEAAWAPDTEVGEELFATPGIDQTFREWRRAFEARNEVAGLLVRTRVKASSLRKAVGQLVSFRDLQPVVHPDAFDTAQLHDQIKRHAEVLEERLELCTAQESCKLVANNRAFIAHIRALAGEEDPDHAVSFAFGSPIKGSRSGGRAVHWGAHGKRAFTEVVDAWDEFKQGVAERLHALLVTDIRQYLLPAIAHTKAEYGRAGFDDLLFRAAALLRDGAVRARLAQRFDALLIDEVQDTDPIQAEVAALLARDPTVAGPWRAEAPRPGHLFAVGDPKQSIYRFRRADVVIWDQLRELVSRAGEHLELRQNFRSVPGIVRWVDHAFADLPDHTDQKPWRREAELDPVVVIPVEAPEDEIAAVVAHLVDLERRGARVVDRDSGALRPMRWDDVMVLLPSWTRAEEVQRALVDAQIPALVEGGKGFLERDAIHLCLAAMRAIDEPSDAEAVVLVLRGFFACTHDDLLRHKNADGSWRYTLPEHPPGPVADAFAVVRELHFARGRRGWVPLLDELLRRSRAATVWSLLRDGDSRLANLDKLRTLIRQLEPDCPSPGDVVARLEEIAAGERDLNRSDLDAAAVGITSYFKAKGLEAPVVALCCATRTYSSGDPVMDRRGGRVALKVGADLPPPGWEAVWKPLDKQEATDERRRWMYVAATRARDQLVLAVSPKAELAHDYLLANHPGIEGAAHDDLVAVAAGATTRVRHLDQLPQPPSHNPTFPDWDERVDELLADPPERVSGETEAWEQGQRDQVRSSVRGCVRWRSVQEVATRERVRGGTGDGVGAVGGVLVHEVLEHLDLGLPIDAVRSSARELLARFSPARIDDETYSACVGIVERILDHEVIAAARHAPERWQEVPFIYKDRGRQVSGTIDLCFPANAERTRWVVVDWKSDVPPVDTPAHRNYERQLALYAKALLATVAPCEHVETLLVGPYPELGVPDPAEHAVAMVVGPLKAGLQGLLASGVPVPQVGLDIGEGMVISELAWGDRRLAVLLDPPVADVDELQREAWTVLAVDTSVLTWSEGLIERLTALWLT